METDGKTIYLEATMEAGRQFMERGIAGNVVMLNLLRFREQADYSATPDLAPEAPISGREAYERYIEGVEPYLEEAGSEVIFAGERDHFLIGPSDERWDRVLLVRHASVRAFMSFATSDAYLSSAGHRTAALADSRLLPLATD